VADALIKSRKMFATTSMIAATCCGTLTVAATLIHVAEAFWHSKTTTDGNLEGQSMVRKLEAKMGLPVGGIREATIYRHGAVMHATGCVGDGTARIFAASDKDTFVFDLARTVALLHGDNNCHMLIRSGLCTLAFSACACVPNGLTASLAAATFVAGIYQTRADFDAAEALAASVLSPTERTQTLNHYQQKVLRQQQNLDGVKMPTLLILKAMHACRWSPSPQARVQLLQQSINK
jgi:hypothetical protein